MNVLTIWTILDLAMRLHTTHFAPKDGNSHQILCHNRALRLQLCLPLLLLGRIQLGALAKDVKRAKDSVAVLLLMMMMMILYVRVCVGVSTSEDRPTAKSALRRLSADTSYHSIRSWKKFLMPLLQFLFTLPLCQVFMTCGQSFCKGIGGLRCGKTNSDIVTYSNHHTCQTCYQSSICRQSS